VVRVLLCDDSAGAIYMVRARIDEIADIELVGQATDGGECLNSIIAAQPDVALVDHALVAHVSRTDIDRLRDQAPTTALVLYSALADDIIEREAAESGLDGSLSKRSSGPDFAAALRDHADRRRP
jgi:DNA-binding NarL/FixJ family response regulator